MKMEGYKLIQQIASFLTGEEIIVSSNGNISRQVYHYLLRPQIYLRGSMGFFYGGIGQVIAGIWEFRNGNTFAATAFSSYGLFWLTFVFINFFPAMGLTEAVTTIALVPYLFMWGLFTFWMFLSTLKINRALQTVFLTLAILFWLLAIGHLGFPIVNVIAGYEGILCGMSAIYTAMAEVMNEIYGRVILPIGPVGN